MRVVIKKATLIYLGYSEVDISKLKRDPEKAKANLVQVGKTIVTKKACVIQFPVSYENAHLANLGTESLVFGVFPIIFEDGYYTLNNTNAQFRLSPNVIEKTKIDNIDYYVLKFEAGDTLFLSTDLVKANKLVYYAYSYFLEKGNVPWFLNLFDLANIFNTAKEHAGVNLGNKVTVDIIVMTMARDAKETYELYKHKIKSQSDILTNPPAIIPFDSVVWNTSDTTSKLNGSYFNTAVNAALVNRSERVEIIEELLRT